MQRPWLVALTVLALTLVPVWLAFAAFRNAAAQSDRELFDTATRVVQQSLHLATARHVNALTIIRVQISNAPDLAAPAARDLLRQMEWRTRLPHWRAIVCASAEEDGATVRWSEGLAGPAPFREGDDPGSDSRLAGALQWLREHPFQSSVAAWNTNEVAVALAIPNRERRNARGFLIGWLDLDGLCGDAQLPLVREGALRLTPVSERSASVSGEKVLRIEEAGVVWHAAVARGPEFGVVFSRPTPWLVLGGGAICAALLAALAGAAARSREAGLRAAELNVALEAEREAGRLRSHFVHSVSHEFRTPLSVILSSADLLESYADRLAPERRREVLAQIQDSTRQMTQMIEEVLLLGRMESNRVPCKPAPLELAPFCRQIADEITTAARGRNRIELNVAAGLENVALDAALLRSILGNLLSNAVKYSPAGRAVRLTASRENGALTLIVRDEGIGIPREDLLKAGVAFHRGANVGETPGTGLGLAIVNRSAELHGGTFRLDSREGAGTTAVVTLPLNLDTASRVSEAP